MIKNTIITVLIIISISCSKSPALQPWEIHYVIDSAYPEHQHIYVASNGEVGKSEGWDGEFEPNKSICKDVEVNINFSLISKSISEIPDSYPKYAHITFEDPCFDGSHESIFVVKKNSMQSFHFQYSNECLVEKYRLPVWLEIISNELEKNYTTLKSCK